MALAGWNYRKGITITGSVSGPQTDYSVPITVYYGNGTDNGANVYCGSKCAPDFDDIRFTANDGETLIGQWRESKTDGASAVFWVKIPSIAASPATVGIYIYYGNASATDASDIDGAFLWGDDFGVDQGRGYDSFIQQYTGGLAPGGAGAWDEKIREKCAIIRNSSITGNAWDMWYTGHTSSGESTSCIGHAYSSDGLTWTKNPANPVISTGVQIQDPTVIEFDGELLMYVERTQTVPTRYNVDLWVYDDGAGTWGAYASNPVLPVNSSATPLAHIMPNGTTIRLFYEDFANGADVSFADSSDGRVFGTPTVNAIAYTGSDSIPDSIVEDMDNPGTYYLYFHTSIGRRVGRATSSDLTTWTDVKLVPPGSWFESSTVFNVGEEVWAYVWDMSGYVNSSAYAHGGYYRFVGKKSSGQSIDANKWDVTSNGGDAFVDVGGGYASLYCGQNLTTGVSLNMKGKQSFSSDVIIDVKRAVGFYGFANMSFGSGVVRSEDSLATNWWGGCLVDSYVMRYFYVQTNPLRLLKIGSDAGASIGTSTLSNAATLMSQHIDSLIYTSSGDLTWKINGSTVSTVNDTTYLNDNKYVHLSAGAYQTRMSRVYVDWVRVRKYASADPTFTAYATEEYFPDDDTAPNLTAATATASSTSAVSATVTTDTEGGTIYGVLSTSATEMEAADIKSGADDSATVTDAGDYTLNETGLATWTQYYWHIVHEDTDRLMSNVLTIPVKTLDISIPLAFSGTSPATLLSVQVWSKVPTKAEVESLYTTTEE